MPLRAKPINDSGKSVGLGHLALGAGVRLQQPKPRLASALRSALTQLAAERDSQDVAAKLIKKSTELAVLRARFSVGDPRRSPTKAQPNQRARIKAGAAQPKANRTATRPQPELLLLEQHQHAFVPFVAGIWDDHPRLPAKAL